MASVASVKKNFLDSYVANKELIPSLDLVFQHESSILRNISQKRVPIAKVESIKASLFKSLKTMQLLCDELLSHSSPLIDRLDLHIRKFPKKNSSSIVNALDLETPLYKTYSHPCCEKKEYDDLFDSLSHLELIRKCHLVYKRIHNFSEAIFYYKNVLDSLIFIKSIHEKAFPSQFGYVPKETLSLIGLHTCHPIVPYYLNKLGEGSYGTVSRIVVNNVHYAYKTFHGESAENHYYYESGVQLCIPPHESITSVKALSHQGLILDLHSEGSLHHAVLQDRCGYRDIVEIFLGIASGLEHIHKQGYNYKDLKLNNVLLYRTDGEERPLKAKLCDLGFLAPSSTDVDHHVYRLTAAPEVIYCSKRSPITPKSDVWSFGTILFEVLTGGAVPFCREFVEDSNYLEIMAPKRSGAPTAPSELEDKLTRNQARRLKLKDPEGRLLQLASECLDGRPMRRLSTKEIIARLSALSIELSAHDESTETAL